MQEEIPLPADVAANVTSNGFEGVAVTGAGAGEQVWVAVQRELKGDPKGTVRIGRYSVADKTLGVAGLPARRRTRRRLDRPVRAGPGRQRHVRGDRARQPARPEGHGQEGLHLRRAGHARHRALPTVTKTLAVDLLPALQADNGWAQDKVEGLTIAGNGQVYAVTDNDGVEDATGETVFMRLGAAKNVFKPGNGGGVGGGGGEGDGRQPAA